MRSLFNCLINLWCNRQKLLHAEFSNIVLLTLLWNIPFNALHAQSKNMIIEEFSPNIMPLMPATITCTEYIYLKPKTKNISGIVTGLNADGMIKPLSNVLSKSA